MYIANKQTILTVTEEHLIYLMGSIITIIQSTASPDETVNGFIKVNNVK